MPERVKEYIRLSDVGEGWSVWYCELFENGSNKKQVARRLDTKGEAREIAEKVQEQLKDDVPKYLLG